MTIEDRASKLIERLNPIDWEYNREYKNGYIKGATDQKELDKKIINMLIDMLQTSKNYHLGITALDSPKEIIEKRRMGETALIRNIEDKIKKAKRVTEE